MVEPIYFDNGRSAASMQSAGINREQAKTSAFEEALKSAAESEDDKKIMEAAREFESYFIKMMLKEMRNTVPKGELIPRNNAEEIFQDMLDEEYSNNAAAGNGIGLAQMIFEQMTRGSRTPPEMPANITVAAVANTARKPKAESGEEEI